MKISSQIAAIVLVSVTFSASALTRVGPYSVYGDIEKKWLQHGGASGPMGAPLSNEHDQIGHGRVQRFAHGVISWTPEAGAVERRIGGDSTTFDTGYVPSSLPMGGFMQLRVQRNGDYQLTLHTHDSGATNISYAFTALLVGADGQPFTFPHQGHLEGTTGAIFGHPKRNSDFVKSGHNPLLAAHYDQLVETGSFIGVLTGEDKLRQGMQGLLEDALKSLAAAGMKAAIALI
jgi:LGFP repeat